MNLIDKVILEWSYKTKKGYPDINNKDDIRIFESMFGIDLTEEITTKRSLRAAAHVQTQLISYPKTLTTDATVDPDHYSYLYGPISVAEGTTITVEQDSILTIH